MPDFKLNKAQREAVEYVAGPLLIVAGAGTGKTTVITSKICRLLEEKLAKPEEVLALTFTDQAAEEMQTRVDEITNVGYADLHISTFHAFCQKILEHHAIDIGLSNSFKLLTDTAGWILIQKNLDKFNLNYYRPLGNPTKHIHEFLKHFSKCKDELITPEEYLEYAEGTKKDQNGALGGEEKNRLTELALAYHTYNQLLRDSALMDFGDLLSYTVKLFRERPNILKLFQNKYKYILVDEFQDVNYAQYELIKLLADEKSQLTVVGDDDQSIYAFRGASVSNILRFKDDYQDAKEVVLSENFRSGQAILDVAYKSIQNNNPDRLEVKLKIDKKLIAKKTVISTTKPARHADASQAGGEKSRSRPRTDRDSSPPRAGRNDNLGTVTHIHKATAEEEVTAVLTEIVRLKDANEDITWDDFAILVRANSHADAFINGFESRGIPYEFLASSGLYRQAIILDCVNFFKVLSNFHESSAIYRLLCLPFLEFKENDLQKITSGAKRKSISYYEALKRAAEFGVSPAGVAVGNKLIDIIHAGLQATRADKPSVVLYNFLENSGYLTYLTHQENKGVGAVIRQIRYLKQFFDYIAEYEAITPDAHVNNFIEHFLMVVAAGDKGSLYQPSDTPESINILTVHAAKGLEWRYVFVVNLVEDRFPARSRSEALQIPDPLVKEQLPEGDSHLQEERRLFYVAMTRAKERLYFTSAFDYGGVRAKKISRFLDEIGLVAPENKAKKKIELPKKTERAKPAAPGEYEMPKTFSFSQLRSYETCPYQYKLAHILRIPMKGSASFSFGLSLHSTLQAFYERIKELNSASQVSLFDTPPRAVAKKDGLIKAPEFAELLKIYDAKWISDWYQNKRQREDMYKKGKDILKVFYSAEEGNWNIPIGLESWFKIKVGEYVMNGRIDRLDQLPDGTIEIIDYKTGQSKDKLTSDDKEQLLLYQIAVGEISEFKNIGKPSKLTFYYLNDEIKQSFIGESKDLEKLKAKLAGTISQIMTGDFTATPSQFVCARCDWRDICEWRV